MVFFSMNIHYHFYIKKIPSFIYHYYSITALKNTIIITIYCCHTTTIIIHHWTNIQCIIATKIHHNTKQYKYNFIIIIIKYQYINIIVINVYSLYCCFYLINNN